MEDDENIREIISDAFGGAGLNICAFEGANGLYKECEKELPSLFLLDIMLPGEDGISILKNIKGNNQYCDIPVIMLTAKGSEYDKIKGLDLGADDYVTKPFSVLELISRVKAVLRRTKKTQAEILKVGDIRIDEAKRAVFVGEEEITLTYKEFELLILLLKNKGIVLSRDKILQNVWGYEFEGESRTVDMHIKTLRQKLLGCGALVETVRGVGYKIKQGDEGRA